MDKEHFTLILLKLLRSTFERSPKPLHSRPSWEHPMSPCPKQQKSSHPGRSSLLRPFEGISCRNVDFYWLPAFVLLLPEICRYLLCPCNDKGVIFYRQSLLWRQSHLKPMSYMSMLSLEFPQPTIKTLSFTFMYLCSWSHNSGYSPYLRTTDERFNRNNSKFKLSHYHSNAFFPRFLKKVSQYSVWPNSWLVFGRRFIMKGYLQEVRPKSLGAAPKRKHNSHVFDVWQPQ